VLLHTHTVRDYRELFNQPIGLFLSEVQIDQGRLPFIFRHLAGAWGQQGHLLLIGLFFDLVLALRIVLINIAGNFALVPMSKLLLFIR
jgi:hypothetical protein